MAGKRRSDVDVPMCKEPKGCGVQSETRPRSTNVLCSQKHFVNDTLKLMHQYLYVVHGYIILAISRHLRPREPLLENCNSLDK